LPEKITVFNNIQWTLQELAAKRRKPIYFYAEEKPFVFNYYVQFLW